VHIGAVMLNREQGLMPWLSQ